MLKIWEISGIPADTSPERNVAMQIRRFLFSLEHASCSCVSTEILFRHDFDNKVKIYFVLRNSSKQQNSTLEKQLRMSGYMLQALDEKAAADFCSKMSSFLQADTSVVLKSEKLVTTPMTQEGYYYWADALLERENEEYDNFSMLFQTLQNCGESYVSFQLISAALQPYELETLQLLDMSLESRVHGALPNQLNGMLYESYAIPAYTAYHQMVQRQGQPVFLYNILAGSRSGQSRRIAEQVIALIKAESQNAPDLQAVPVNLQAITGTYDDVPFHLNEFLMYQCRNSVIWSGRLLRPERLLRFPFLVTADEALLFFRLPVDDGVITGITATPFQPSNEVLAAEVTDANNITLGRSTGSENVMIGVPPELFAQHALIVGMPGTGKTTLAFHLLLQFQKKGIPFLAIEPTKREYRSMIDAIPDLQIFTPGNQEISPFVFNPFVPPQNVPLERYLPSLFSAFQAALNMTEPLDDAFLKAIQGCYTKYGWRNYSKVGDPGTTLFGMLEFIMYFRNMIQAMDYEPKVKGNLTSGGVLRLSRLIEQNATIFDTIQSMPMDELLDKPTVIELDAIDNGEQKSLIIALLLIRISAYLKAQDPTTRKMNVILLDEAHVLLGQHTSEKGSDSAQNYASQMMENMIAELRALGTGVIVADQRPSAVGTAVVANTDIKVVFRLTERNEKEIIGNSISLSEEAQKTFSQLRKGQAYVLYYKMTKPQVIQTVPIRDDAGLRDHVPDDEVKTRCKFWKTHAELLKPFKECWYCRAAGNTCNGRLRADALYYAARIWEVYRTQIKSSDELLQYVNGVPRLIASMISGLDSKTRETVIICTRIALLRKAALEAGLQPPKKRVAVVLETAEIKE